MKENHRPKYVSPVYLALEAGQVSFLDAMTLAIRQRSARHFHINGNSVERRVLSQPTLFADLSKNQ
ncbi:hypothetical protein [Paraburkholderia mimosarum]|uniref:hypothetical protein n=1 Tax=Paraburkholderia mimosarum TaxID=312026 RepID=UPI0004060DFB|nr:hypothetical protein [Paraburkholderia mimosarum]